VLVDGAQAAAHVAVDFKALGADFYAVSSHKAYGPTGFGALLARREHLEAMPPWLGGGDMIRTVAFEGSTWNDVPYKFEAGTPDIAGVIGFGAAARFLQGVGGAMTSAVVLGMIVTMFPEPREQAKANEPDAEKRRALLRDALDGFRFLGKVRYPQVWRERRAETVASTPPDTNAT